MLVIVRSPVGDTEHLLLGCWGWFGKSRFCGRKHNLINILFPLVRKTTLTTAMAITEYVWKKKKNKELQIYGAEIIKCHTVSFPGKLFPNHEDIICSKKSACSS